MARSSLDELSKAILETLKQVGEPLDTREIEDRLTVLMSGVTRIKLVLRLQNLRGEGLIRGKSIGSGRGAWIWWIHQITQDAINQHMTKEVKQSP